MVGRKSEGLLEREVTGVKGKTIFIKLTMLPVDEYHLREFPKVSKRSLDRKGLTKFESENALGLGIFLNDCPKLTEA
jgi:hypothetical protein